MGINFARDGNGGSAVATKFAQASCPPKRTDWQSMVYAATDGGWSPPGLGSKGGKR